MEVVYYATYRTPWVTLLVASGAQGLVAVRFIPRGEKEPIPFAQISLCIARLVPEVGEATTLEW